MPYTVLNDNNTTADCYTNADADVDGTCGVDVATSGQENVSRVLEGHVRRDPGEERLPRERLP